LIKEVDEKLFQDLQTPARYGEFSVLHAMFYAFLEPVLKQTNNTTKTYLTNLKKTYELPTFDSFLKGTESVAKPVSINLSI
jgi:hypothetical protein